MDESKPDALFEMVRERYGDRLSPDEIEEVREAVQGMADAAEAIRAEKLDNGVEPFSVFTPYRKER